MNLPVTVIGGYLGAGKTTLINHLLRHANGARLAVLVNEFGALSIDADLIEAKADGLLSISGGCVCCAYGSDMIGALEDMRDATPGFDHVLLEASGVALPGSILTTVGMVRGLRADAAVVLADAEQVRRNAGHKFLSDTVLRQLAQADILVVTKTDLVAAAALRDLTRWLEDRAPRARILHAAHGRLPGEAILGSFPDPGSRPVGADTVHDSFASFVLRPSAPTDAQSLARRLAQAPSVTRAKGFVDTADGSVLIHVVGTRFQLERLDEPRAVGIVCIGAKEALTEAAVARLAAPASQAS